MIETAANFSLVPYPTTYRSHYRHEISPVYEGLVTPLVNLFFGKVVDIYPQNYFTPGNHDGVLDVLGYTLRKNPSMAVLFALGILFMLLGPAVGLFWGVRRYREGVFRQRELISKKKDYSSTLASVIVIFTFLGFLCFVMTFASLVGLHKSLDEIGEQLDDVYNDMKVYKNHSLNQLRQIVPVNFNEMQSRITNVMDKVDQDVQKEITTMKYQTEIVNLKEILFQVYQIVDNFEEASSKFKNLDEDLIEEEGSVASYARKMARFSYWSSADCQNNPNCVVVSKAFHRLAQKPSSHLISFDSDDKKLTKKIMVSLNNVYDITSSFNRNISRTLRDELNLVTFPLQKELDKNLGIFSGKIRMLNSTKPYAIEDITKRCKQAKGPTIFLLFMVLIFLFAPLTCFFIAALFGLIIYAQNPRRSQLLFLFDVGMFIFFSGFCIIMAFLMCIFFGFGLTNQIVVKSMSDIKTIPTVYNYLNSVANASLRIIFDENKSAHWDLDELLDNCKNEESLYTMFKFYKIYDIKNLKNWRNSYNAISTQNRAWSQIDNLFTSMSSYLSVFTNLETKLHPIQSKILELRDGYEKRKTSLGLILKMDGSNQFEDFMEETTNTDVTRRINQVLNVINKIRTTYEDYTRTYLDLDNTMTMKNSKDNENIKMEEMLNLMVTLSERVTEYINSQLRNNIYDRFIYGSNAAFHHLDMFTDHVITFFDKDFGNCRDFYKAYDAVNAHTKYLLVQGNGAWFALGMLVEILIIIVIMLLLMIPRLYKLNKGKRLSYRGSFGDVKFSPTKTGATVLDKKQMKMLRKQKKLPMATTPRRKIEISRTCILDKILQPTPLPPAPPPEVKTIEWEKGHPKQSKVE